MQLTDVTLRESPRQSAWVRLSGIVHGAGGRPAEEIWMDVADRDAAALAPVGDPFLAWLAPLAALRGESLQLEAPVDAELLDNVREVTRVWQAWFPGMREVAVEAPVADRSSPAGVAPAVPRGAAAMFTGGVDSFFTVLRHDAREGTPRTIPIDTLIFVHGFDVPLGNAVAAARVTRSLQQAADALGKRFVVAVTNLRESCFAATDWAGHSHGAALAGVGHALGAGHDTVLIGSSAGYRDLRFWGSHPLTDPMFSSSRLRVVHDGAAFMRVEKTEYVARTALALQHLRVCYQSETGDNCGRCNSCYRTMLALEALGALARCATFDRGALDLGTARRIYCRRDFDVRQFGYVRDLARRLGRDDIADAVQCALDDSARLTRRIAFLRRLRDARVVWRWAPAWERRLLRGWID